MPDGQLLIAGMGNTSNNETQIIRSGSVINTACIVENQNGNGLIGRSVQAGLLGHPTIPGRGTGVYGSSGIGVYGMSGDSSGVHGESQDGWGVYANSDRGYGVAAHVRHRVGPKPQNESVAIG